MAARELLIYEYGLMPFLKKQLLLQRDTTLLLHCTDPGNSNAFTGKLISLGVAQPVSCFVMAVGYL